MSNSGTESYTKKAHFNAFTTFLSYLWPAHEPDIKKRVIYSFVLIVISKVAAAGVPIYFKQAIDIFTANDRSLFKFAILLIAVYGTSRVLSIGLLEFKEFLFAKVEQRAVRLMAFTAFQHLQQLSLRFHLDRQTGAIARIIERGSKGAEAFLKFATFSLVPIFIEVLFILIIIYYFYGYSLMLLVALGIGLYIGYSIAITQWRAQFVRNMNEADNACGNQTMESLVNYETVQYFNNNALELKRFNKTQHIYEKAAIKNKIGLSLLNVGQGVIVSFGLITTLSYAAYAYMNYRMSLGDLVLLNTYLLQLYYPLGILGFAYREIKRALVDMENLFDLLKLPIEVTDKPNALPLVINRGEIEFKDVSFFYHADRPILKNVSFIVPAGKKVAIVGRSGAGKSTISRLLFRFYDVTKGEILIDSQDIRDVRQGSLKSQIGVVPQDIVLFNETIFYNILYGRPDATKHAVTEAAKKAHLEDFISSLPKGYDTLVGERGLKVSGGEKQRISIARTILKNPKILLFDEATSSLDVPTEKAIQKNLNEISAHRTTLVIAHRLSTVIDAHNIIVLKNGHIVEQGSHTELLQMKGEYAEMWEKQSRGIYEA